MASKAFEAPASDLKSHSFHAQLLPAKFLERKSVPTLKAYTGNKKQTKKETPCP